jgi:hypothetical protein
MLSNNIRFGNENALRTNQTSKASSSITSNPSRRRILGDITNSTVEDPSIRNAALQRKPSAFVTSTVTAAMEVVDDGRIYMQRPVDDIDSKDQENPIMVSLYANDMYQHFFEVEREFRVNGNYMTKQEFVNDKMRCILIDWLVSPYCN